MNNGVKRVFTVKKTAFANFLWFIQARNSSIRPIDACSVDFLGLKPNSIGLNISNFEENN